MAARRLSKSAIDWTSLSQKIPAKQAETFRVFRAHTDKYQFKLSELPKELPKIDFAEYSKKITNTAMLQEFEKMYNAMSVPYPKDSENVKSSLEVEQKEAEARMRSYLEDQNTKLKAVQDVVDTIDSVPPPEQMTRQMFNVYFPDMARNPNFENPGFGPHTMPEAQLENLMKSPQFYNNRNHRRNVVLADEFEIEEKNYFGELEKKKKLGEGKEESK